MEEANARAAEIAAKRSWFDDWSAEDMAMVASNATILLVVSYVVGKRLCRGANMQATCTIMCKWGLSKSMGGHAGGAGRQLPGGQRLPSQTLAEAAEHGVELPGPAAKAKAKAKGAMGQEGEKLPLAARGSRDTTDSQSEWMGEHV